MTKYILHGGYMKVDNDLNREFFNEISRDLEENDKVLIICFAREENQYEEIFERDKENILKNSDNKVLEISMATEDNFINQVKESKAILIEGGSIRKLLKILKQHPEFIKSIKEKVVAGSSAGAYVLSKYLYSNTEDMVIEGLDILPVRTICHYGGNQEWIDKMNEYPEELELIVLRDYEYKIINK